MPKLYEIPFLYDLAFRRLGIGNHVDALIECHDRLRSEYQLQSILELASGPGRHALEFAYRNYRAAVVDSSQEMCQYAAKIAAGNNLELNVNCLDMRDFSIAEKFDLAMIMLNSIGHVHSTEDLDRHIETVWRHLNPHGLYVIEAHYPPWRDAEALKVSSWKMELNEFQLSIDFGTADDDYDSQTHIRKLKLRIYGRLMNDEIDFSDFLTIRSWSQEDLEKAFERTGLFKIAAKLGSLDLNDVFHPDQAERLVYVLQKDE